MAFDIDLILRRSRPCPFATEADSETHALRIESNVAFDQVYIRCACGSSSPVAKTAPDAVARWNTRYSDVVQVQIELAAGRAALAAQRLTDDANGKFAAMQVENNRLLDRALAAEAELATAKGAS